MTIRGFLFWCSNRQYCEGINRTNPSGKEERGKRNDVRDNQLFTLTP